MPNANTLERKPLENGARLAPLARHITLRAPAPVETGSVTRAVPGLDMEARTLEMTFSSEEPVDRWFGSEVLSHAAGCADLSRLNDGAPLLFNHDMDDVIGVVERAWIGEDGLGHCIVRFARTPRGDEILGMVQDGVLRNVSFMYRVAKYRIDSESEDPYYDDDATYTATEWMAYEISIVTVPADQTVGIGRSDSPQARSVVVEFRAGAVQAQPGAAVRTVTQPTEEEPMTPKFRRTPVANAAEAATSTAPGAVTPAVDAGKAERERVEGIVALGRKHDLNLEKVHDMIARGIDLAAARGEVLDDILAKSQKPVADFGETFTPDLTSKEKRTYSVLRMMQAIVSGDWSKAGFEREVSSAIAKRMGRETGVFLPNDLPFAPDDKHMRAWQMLSSQGKVQFRAPYQVGTAAQGGNLVQTALLSESFIEVLRNQLVTAIMGARYLTGLTSNIDIPRQNSQTATNWVGESGAMTEAEATFDKVSLRPKTITAFSKMSRLMMLQANPAIEMLARNDLLAVIALAMDLAAISGSGSANQPTGIVNTAGIGSVVGGTNGANLSFDHLIQLKYITRIANAPQSATGFALNSKSIGYLSTLKATTGQYLWDPQGGLTAGSPDRVKGSPYGESQQLRSTLTKGTSAGICSELVYGNWQELFIALWGVTELMFNPYDSTGFQNGDVLIRAMQTCDVGVRHAASFSAMADALTPGF